MLSPEFCPHPPIKSGVPAMVPWGQSHPLRQKTVFLEKRGTPSFCSLLRAMREHSSFCLKHSSNYKQTCQITFYFFRILFKSSTSNKFTVSKFDTTENGYELLALSFDGSMPKFAENAKSAKIVGKDLTIYYDMQSPMSINPSKR